LVLGDAASAGAGISLFFLFFALYIVIIVGSLVFLVVSLVDMAKRPDWQWKIAGQEKTLWIVLVVVLNLFAIVSFIYWFNVRKKLIAVERAAAAGQFGPGTMTYGGWSPGPSPAFATVTPPSWQPDPSGLSRWRWWDGRQWTGHVSDGDSGPNPVR
jgi:heme/copper-type cytochrome/quinol oxidase subunit 2